MTPLALFAVLTLECPNRHRWEEHWPVIQEVIQAPTDAWCSECGRPGKLVVAQEGG